MEDMIKTLIEEYADRVYRLEQDMQDEGICVSASHKSTQATVYRKVIEDLRNVLHGDEL